MKNLTLTISDELYRAARVTAAQRETSISALVASQLEEITGMSQSARASARDELMEVLERVRRDNPGFNASDRLPRDELYTRGIR